MCHRDTQLLENGRIHRTAMRLYRRSQGTYSRHPDRRPRSPQQTVAAPSVYQVQRHQLRHPTCGRSHLYAGRQRAGKGQHRLLYAERLHHERGTGSRRAEGIRRCQRSLPLAEDTRRHQLVALLRTDALRGQRGGYAGCRFRPQRRRLYPPDRLRPARRLRGSHEAHPQMDGLTERSRHIRTVNE